MYHRELDPKDIVIKLDRETARGIASHLMKSRMLLLDSKICQYFLFPISGDGSGHVYGNDKYGSYYIKGNSARGFNPEYKEYGIGVNVLPSSIFGLAQRVIDDKIEARMRIISRKYRGLTRDFCRSLF